VFSPKPYKDASFGNFVDISRYWSLNTSELYGSEDVEVVLKRVSPFDFLFIEKLNGFEV
jgi:hypothetical protein